jgi:hypothetical protein
MATGGSPRAQPPLDCHAVKLVAARGSGERLPPLGEMAGPISAYLARRAKAAGIDYRAYGLPYTAVALAMNKAAIQAPEYWLSERQGRNMLRAYIRRQVSGCKGEKLFLFGYSQGAHVVGDVLSKGIGGLNREESSRIAAVALIGDPRFNSREQYDMGSFRIAQNGILGARAPGDLRDVAARTRSWCRFGDIVCQRRGTPAAHQQNRYLDDYAAGIVNFLAAKVGWPQEVIYECGNVLDASGITGSFRITAQGIGCVPARGVVADVVPLCSPARASCVVRDWRCVRRVSGDESYHYVCRYRTATIRFGRYAG